MELLHKLNVKVRFFAKKFVGLKNSLYLCTRNAQVAELVDAHVSGACAARREGSSPFLGTGAWRCKSSICSAFFNFSFFNFSFK